MKRRILTVFMSLIIVALILYPVIAFGYVKDGECTATLLQEGEYALETETHKNYSAPLKATAMSAEDDAYNQLLSAPSSINVARYNISVDDVSAFFSNVVNDHPDLFFVSSSIKYNYYPSTNTVANIFPQYAIDTDEIASAQEIFYNGSEKALATVDSSMSDIQKALTVHEYICNLANYPVVYDENGYFQDELDQDIYHSAYGFFYNQTVVCAGFTLAYSYLMNELGVPCEYVSSDYMEHAWNKIQLNGNWYNVDLTYDDFDDVLGKTTYGSISHKYFLKSDSYFENNTNIHIHLGGMTADSCSATDTAYDSMFWDNVNSRIYSLNGDFYYLKPNANYSAVYLKKRTVSGSETTVGVGFSCHSLTYTASDTDANGNSYEFSFTDAMARIAYLDGRFYVAAKTSIYSLSFDGTKQKITDIDDDPMGLSDNENGNLYYQIYDDDTVYELDKTQYFKNHLTTVKGVNYNNFPDVNNDSVINGKDYALILKQKNN